MRTQVIPAILAKSRHDLLSRINSVLPFVKRVQIDIMDNLFVPNKTIGLESLHDLPKGVKYEFHWMVKDPKNCIMKTPGPHIHLIHIETIPSQSDFSSLLSLAAMQGAKLGLAINPETPIERLFPYISEVAQVLIMTVHPGFSGQSYICEMEQKIRYLRAHYPKLDIEVDGGINLQTIRRAYSSGANLLVAASAIFASNDICRAINDLKIAARASS